MPKRYEITIPGLSMKDDFPAARRRLLAEFPRVVEVLAMTTPALRFRHERAQRSTTRRRRSGKDSKIQGVFSCRPPDQPSAPALTPALRVDPQLKE
jgi:hypothetical protein